MTSEKARRVIEASGCPEPLGNVIEVCRTAVPKVWEWSAGLTANGLGDRAGDSAEISVKWWASFSSTLGERRVTASTCEELLRLLPGAIGEVYSLEKELWENAVNV